MNQQQAELMKMTQTRKRLLFSPVQRQEAIAAFPLHVADIANQMMTLIKVRRDGPIMGPPSSGFPGLSIDECIDEMEKRIRQHYRDTFGAELGGDALESEDAGKPEGGCVMDFEPREDENVDQYVTRQEREVRAVYESFGYTDTDWCEGCGQLKGHGFGTCQCTSRMEAV